MAKKATIQILRGSNKSTDETTVLGAGELFYDLQTGLLYVGDGDPNHNLKWLYDNKKCLVTLDNLSGTYPNDYVQIGNGASAGTQDVAIGQAESSGLRSVAIGSGTSGGKARALSSDSVAIGSNTLVQTDCGGSVAIGSGAKIASHTSGAVQIGYALSGNNVANSFRFRDKVIVDGSGNINADTAKDYDTSSGTIKTNFDSILGSGVTGSGDAPLQGYDKGKGTIESRLSSLGFSQGDLVVQLLNTRVTLSNDVNKQGNVVWCSVSIVSSNGFSYNKNDYLLFLPNGFSPTSQAKFNITKVGTQDGICGHFNANGRQGFAETNPPASFYDSGEYRIIFCWRIGD